MARSATEQAKLNSLLAEGKKLAKDMGDAASLTNLDKYKNDLVQTESLVKNLRTEWKEYTEDVNGTVTTFHRIVDEIVKMSQGSKIAQSAFRKLTNIASELESHQLGINNLSSKELEKLKSKVTIQQNILKQSQKLIEDEIKNIKNVSALKGKELLNYNTLKSLQISVNEEIKKEGNTIAKLNKQFDTQIAKTKQIEKTLGLTGALIKGISKIPIIGNLVDTNKALKEMEKVAKEGGGRFATMNAGLGSIGKDIFTHLTDPLTIGTGLINGLISGFKKIVELGFAADEEINSLSKSMGSSREQAASLRQHFVDIQNGSVKINSSLDINLQTTKNLVAAQLELADAFGTSLGFTDEQLADQVLLTKQMGFAGEEAAGLQQLALANKISVKDVTNSVIKQTAALAKQTGIQFDNKKIIGEVAKVSGQLSANYKNDPALIAKAVVQANKLGLTLTQAAEASSKLLDFESSIQNELEAELLTGKDLNLEKARLLALNGDAAGAAAEMLAQVGSLSEFQNMNVLQQEALAKAVGMTAGGLADSLRQQENLNKLGDKAKKQIQEKAELLRKNGDIEGANRLMNSIGNEKDAQDALAKIDAQTNFNNLIEKVQSMLGSMAEGPMAEILDKISKWVSNADNVKGLMNTIKSIATGIGSVIGFVIKHFRMLASVAIVIAAYTAYASAAAIPVIGVGLGIIAAAAVLAAGFGALYAISDGHIGKDGGLIVSGEKGSYQLDKNDSVIAGTNLVNDVGVKPDGSKGSISFNSESIVNELKTIEAMLQNTYELQANIERGIILLTYVESRGRVYLDSTHVGTATNIGTYKVQ